MHDITPEAVVIGIDTHKDVHVAVAIHGLGARLATASFPVTSQGYRQVAAWAADYGVVHAFGIAGTGSYGAGLTRALTGQIGRAACGESGCQYVVISVCAVSLKTKHTINKKN